MKKFFGVLLVISFSLIIAGETVIKDDVHGYLPESNTVIDGRDYRTGFPEDCTNYLPAEFNNTVAPKPHYPNIWQGPGSSIAPSFGENPADMFLWGDDVLVDPGALGEQPISADRGGDGDTVFVGVIKHGTGVDSVKVFRSIDHGATWSLFRVAYGTDQTYSNLTLRYARGAQNWIFIFWLITDATNNGDVWGMRISVDGSPWAFFHPTTLGDPDTISWVTATRDFNTDYGLNVFWQEGGYPDYTIWRTRSTDYGDNWGTVGNNQSGAMNPHIDYGADGYLYICTKKIERNDIYVGRSTNYGASGSWGGWTYITNDSNEHTEALPRVAATHDTGATGKAWVTYNYFNGSDWDSRYGYTTDGGSSWQTDNVLAGGSGSQGATDIECSGYGSIFTRAVFLNDVYGAYKLDYRSNDGTNPTSWGSPITLSDTFVYGGLIPKITNYGVGTGNSGLAAFPGPSQSGLWIDYFGNSSGIEKGLINTPSILGLKILPNPLKNSALIYYNLAKKSEIEFSAYNTNGERVASIDDGIKSAGEHCIRWNGDKLPNGIYFLTLKANGTRIAMQKVTLMK
jgi:hypothetical protein